MPRTLDRNQLVLHADFASMSVKNHAHRIGVKPTEGTTLLCGVEQSSGS